MHDSHTDRCLVGGPLVEYPCGFQHPTMLCSWETVTTCVCEHNALVELVRGEAGIIVNRVPITVETYRLPYDPDDDATKVPERGYGDIPSSPMV